LHLVDATTEHAGKAYKTVRAELEAYGNGLSEKPEIVALSKADVVDAAGLRQQAQRLKRAAKRSPLILSSATHQGVEAALRALAAEIPTQREASLEPESVSPSL